MSKQIRIAAHKLTHSYTSLLHCQQIFMKHFVTWTKTFLVMWTFFIATKVIENITISSQSLKPIKQICCLCGGRE